MSTKPIRSALCSKTAFTFALLAALTPACVGQDAEVAEDGEEALTQGTKPWDLQAEKEWGEWVGRIGKARARKECIRINDCLRKPAINSLYKDEDASLNVFADCADLPVELRAYFAVRTGRPARWVSSLNNPDTRDERYAAGLTPKGWSHAGQFTSMQKMLTSISNTVHSGFFRMAGEVEKSDTYPIDISREALQPGTVFYDPNGHVLLVYQVDGDGTVHLIDGHPDNSLSEGIFTQKFSVGGAKQGGGFRRFRPFAFDGTSYTPATNAKMASPGYGLSATAQYSVKGKAYYDKIASVLSKGVALDPLKRFDALTEQLCLDLQDRAEAVAGGAAAAAASARSGTLGGVPSNIYGASGEWESLSTPSRDARFKASFRGMGDFIEDAGKLVDARSPTLAWTKSKAELMSAFKSKWATVTSSCKITYKNSAGGSVAVTLATAEARLFNLSFDPYHCTEMRWGAYGVSANEMASCKPSAAHVKRFQDERRQRNAIDREYGAPTPFAWGPETPEDVNVTSLLGRL